MAADARRTSRCFPVANGPARQHSAFGIVCTPVRTDRHLFLTAVAAIFVGALALYAAKPADFSIKQIGEIWTELWKSNEPELREPKIESLSELEVLDHMTGKWTVTFGVIPDKVTINIRTNRTVELSGQKDGKDWRNDGEWRVVSNKLVLFLEKDDIPSFVFRKRQQNYIFDPWAKTLMSELKREQ